MVLLSWLHQCCSERGAGELFHRNCGASEKRWEKFFWNLRENKIWVGNSRSSCWLVWSGETARCLPGLMRSPRWRLAIEIDFKIAEKYYCSQQDKQSWRLAIEIKVKIAEKYFCLQQDKYSLRLAMNWLVWTGETARCLPGISRSPRWRLAIEMDFKIAEKYNSSQQDK